MVRFRFLGNGHGASITGHMHLSWDETAKRWSLRYWRKSDAMRDGEDGDDPHDGGALFVEQLGHFWSDWRQKQQDAIDVHYARTKLLKPNDKFLRPGFRAISVWKSWQEYERGVTKEAALIEQDVHATLAKLWRGKWCAEEPNLTIPQLVFLNPWEQKG